MLKEYQQRIDNELQQYELPYWAPLSILARLTEEVGEVARIMNHQFGDKPKKNAEEHNLLEDELADVIYAVICIANSQDLDLDAAMERSIAKLSTRDKDRFNKKQYKNSQ